MTPSRPYLVRALYEWIIDNGMTPHLLVDATREDVVVPEQYVNDGRIVLNIDPNAVQNLQLDNDQIQFMARFAGRAMRVSVPTLTVLAVYARENGQGMMFGDEGEVEPPPEPPAPEPPKRPGLRVVK